MRVMDTLRGLVNSISGLGGERDKAARGEWHYRPLDRQQVESAYRSNWMCRKAVDVPAFDMMREGWTWQAEDSAIELIEAEEKRLRVRHTVLSALKQARLYGGAAIIVSDGSDDPSQPLEPRRIGKGGLSHIMVMDRYHLTSGDLDTDPLSTGYMEPTYYDLVGTAGGSVRVHPSRVIRFIGAEIPTDWEVLQDRWGDSVLDAIEIAIRDATAGQQGIAALIQEAKVDVFKVADFMGNISRAEYRRAVEDRFGLVNRLKSTVNAVVLDAQDEYQQKSVDFSALPDVQRLQLQIVSGAADIPATRFLGQSPAGLSSTGESDLENYYNRVQAEQELMLRDKLERLFEFIVRSALGSYPDDAHFTFRPLWQMSEKDSAQVTLAKAQAHQIDVNAALIPAGALAKARVNQLVEDSVYPGLEAAMEEAEAEEAAITFAEPGERGEEEGGEELTGDAAPRTLYVSRKVINAEEIIAWAKAQGFTSTLPASDLHVTIAYSRQPVDWMKVGEAWQAEIKITEGGPRLMERFGDAMVLLFGASELGWRHEDIKRAGASWDHPEYQPHITISYEGAPADIDSIEPYRGEIVLGPEVFEELDERWNQGVIEE